MKTTYEELGTYLTEVAEHEIRTYNFTTCSVCYLPIIGYLLLVPAASVETLNNLDIEMVYSTEQSVGFKSPGMHELDRKVFQFNVVYNVFSLVTSARESLTPRL